MPPFTTLESGLWPPQPKHPLAQHTVPHNRLAERVKNAADRSGAAVTRGLKSGQPRGKGPSAEYTAASSAQTDRRVVGVGATRRRRRRYVHHVVEETERVHATRVVAQPKHTTARVTHRQMGRALRRIVRRALHLALEHRRRIRFRVPFARVHHKPLRAESFPSPPFAPVTRAAYFRKDATFFVGTLSHTHAHIHQRRANDLGETDLRGAADVRAVQSLAGGAAYAKNFSDGANANENAEAIKKKKKPKKKKGSGRRQVCAW
jgi:hypothetical protein